MVMLTYLHVPVYSHSLSFLPSRMETFYCLRTTYKGEDEIVKWYKLCTIRLHIYINTIKYRYINTKHFSLNYQWQLYEMFCTLYQKNDSFSRCTKQKEIFITAMSQIDWNRPKGILTSFYIKNIHDFIPFSLSFSFSLFQITVLLFRLWKLIHFKRSVL